MGIQWDVWDAGLPIGEPAPEGKPAPAAPAPSLPPVDIIVKQDGTGDYTSLKEAIKAAKKGQIVEIGDSATYEFRDLTGSDATIRGALGHWPVLAPKARARLGAKKAIERVVVDGSKGRLALFAYPDCAFRNVRFRNSTRSVLVQALSGNITFENCLITETKALVQPLGGKGKKKRRVVLRNCTLANVEQIGAPLGSMDCILEATGCVFQRVGVLAQAFKDETVKGEPTISCRPSRNCYHEVGEFRNFGDAAADPDSIKADPKFVDAASGDYHLAPDSPCRGKGPDGKDMGVQWDKWDRQD